MAGSLVRSSVYKHGVGVRANPNPNQARLVASEVASEAGSARWALLARWSFRRALRLRPAHPETLHNLGEFLEQQGDSQRAVLSFGRAVDAAPHNYLHRLTLAADH